MQLLHNLIQQGSISDEDALVAYYDWETWWARENQLAPAVSQSGGDWAIWLMLAGRGFGKTRTGCEWLREKARKGVSPLALIGRTAADVRDVLVEGPAGILAISPPWFRPIYEPAKRRLTWPNGVTATTFSAEAPDQMRGPQHAAALADEIAAWQYFDEAWSNLMLGLRLGDAPQVAAMTTPRPLPMIRELLRDPSVAITRGRTLDNAMNLAKRALDYLVQRYAGTRLGRQELDGELLDDLPGALWTRAMLEAANTAFRAWGSPFAADQFERIVVGVDPSGTKGKERDDGDPIGIVAAGKLHGQERFILLEDCTCQERPEEWAARAVAVWRRWGADMIVAEANYGGDMVRAVMAAHEPNVPVHIVHASKGKAQRAEPISALYEQGKVAHAGGVSEMRTSGGVIVPLEAGNPFADRGFAPLEDELAQFTNAGYKGGASPNRADAAVWALTSLAFGVQPEPWIG